MWIIAIVILVIILLIARKDKSKANVPSDVKNTLPKPEVSVQRSALNDIGVRNSNVSNKDQPWRDPTSYAVLKANMSVEDQTTEPEDLEYLMEIKSHDNPDQVSNAGKINYGASVLYQSPTGGLSSGEIESQLPVPKSACQMMKEQQEIRNIDLQRKLYYGNPTSCKCPFDATSYPRFVWESPASVSNYFKPSFPEDSPFDPIIPFHL